MDDIVEFTPPMAERTTNELISIVCYPDNWNPLAVEQANQELQARNVSTEYQQRKAEVWDRFYERKQLASSQRRAKESYNWLRMFFNPPGFLITVILDWNLKKDGYIRKHKQRKYILLVFAALAAVLYIWAQAL